MNDEVYVVLPAMNEAPRIGKVLDDLRAHGFTRLIVVNDGSKDDTCKVAEQKGAIVLSHLVNVGVGAATKTGIEFALAQGAAAIITIDADGQHFPGDLPTLVDAYREKKVDVVIGSRFLHNDNNIPRSRYLMNRVGNILTALITGIYVTDSQSGLKLFSRAFAQKLDLQFAGYEFCTEIIHLIRYHRASYTEVPIRVRYTSELMSKGQSFKNGVRMIVQFLREFG